VKERDADLGELVEELSAIGRRVRDVVRRGSRSDDDDRVVRVEGGDHIFGVDDRADRTVLAGFEGLAARWGGSLIMEGYDQPVPVGGAQGSGAWRYLVDPVDGTRPYLAGKRSAWVLIGAGREARTLEDLEVSVAVEIPTDQGAYGLVAGAIRHGGVRAFRDDLITGSAPVETVLRPRSGADLDHVFVTVVRFAPGHHEAIGRWQDELLGDLQVFDDLVPCTGGQMMGLATGADAAVFDPRPLLAPGSLAAHPYDLAALVIAREAGVTIEALPPGPLDVPLDTVTPVAWAGYANPAIRASFTPDQLGAAVSRPRPAGGRQSRGPRC